VKNIITPPSSSGCFSPVSLQSACLRRRGAARAFIVGVSALLALSLSFLALAAAPYLRTDRPIQDEQGRVEVIVDFVDDAHLIYPDDPRDKPEDIARFK
jgi:hypothetical protein